MRSSAALLAAFVTAAYVGLELSVQAIVDDVTGPRAPNARRVPIPGY